MGGEDGRSTLGESAVHPPPTRRGAMRLQEATPLWSLLQSGVFCNGGVGGMVWFWLLGLLASVLAGREAGLPQQLPGPGAALNPEHQDQKADHCY